VEPEKITRSQKPLHLINAQIRREYMSDAVLMIRGLKDPHQSYRVGPVLGSVERLLLKLRAGLRRY
jgi:hypothetical protein